MRFRLRTLLILFLLLCLSAPWWVPALQSFLHPPRKLPDIHVNADWDKMTPEETERLWAHTRDMQEQLAREQEELQKSVDEYNRQHAR